VGDMAGLPGQVIDITKQGFVVATLNGAILVKRVQVEGSPKIASAELAGQADLKVGDKLGR